MSGRCVLCVAYGECEVLQHRMCVFVHVCLSESVCIHNSLVACACVSAV